MTNDKKKIKSRDKLIIINLIYYWNKAISSMFWYLILTLFSLPVYNLSENLLKNVSLTSRHLLLLRMFWMWFGKPYSRRIFECNNPVVLDVLKNFFYFQTFKSNFLKMIIYSRIKNWSQFDSIYNLMFLTRHSSTQFTPKLLLKKIILVLVFHVCKILSQWQIFQDCLMHLSSIKFLFGK